MSMSADTRDRCSAVKEPDMNSPLRFRTSNSDGRLPSHEGVGSPRQLPGPQDSTEGKSLGDMSYPLEEAHETRKILQQELSGAKRLSAR
ncbi:hypothetical protein N7522_006802 [Penicillium canescens]|nr:hypothetical protein N7522_006802 [Penicillium canescens]